MRKRRTGGSSEVNGPFPQTVLLWEKVLPVKRHQLWCLFCFPRLDAAGIKWRDGGELRQLFPFWFTAALPSTRQKFACPPLGKRKVADPVDFRQGFCPPPPRFQTLRHLYAQIIWINQNSMFYCSSEHYPPPRAYLPLHPLSQTHKHQYTRVHTRAKLKTTSSTTEDEKKER